MELNAFLTTLLYASGIVLIIIFIIVGIKLIGILDKMDRIADNVEDKLNSFNEAVDAISEVTNRFASIGNSFTFQVSSMASKLFHRKKSKEEDL